MEGQESTKNKSDIEKKSENTFESFKEQLPKIGEETEKEMVQQEIRLPIINVKKSDEKEHQIIESIETKKTMSMIYCRFSNKSSSTRRSKS
jgi:hypothetical protein